MKVLVICQYYYPEEFQINDICEELVRQGHTITVLTGLPNYPTGVIPAEYQHGHKRDEVINDVHVLRCWEIPRRKGIVGLGLNYLSFMLSSSFKAFKMEKDFDVIYVHQYSPVFMALPALIVKSLTGKRIFLYCCDLWPESIKVMHIDESSPIFWIVKIFSSFVYKHCDIVGVQTPAFFKYFEKIHSIENNRLVYIPQFAASEYLNRDFSTQHEGINFVFMGNIGFVQDLGCIVEATEINAQKKLSYKVHIVGDGSFLADLKQMVINKHLETYFVFYGRRPVSEMELFYKLADVCLLTLKGDSFVGQTVPGKLQGYMAAGKMVIAAINGSAQEVIKESRCGLVGKASDAGTLAKNMEKFILHQEQYAMCGINGRLYFKQHFTKEIYINNAVQVLQKLAEAK